MPLPPPPNESKWLDYACLTLMSLSDVQGLLSFMDGVAFNYTNSVAHWARGGGQGLSSSVCLLPMGVPHLSADSKGVYVSSTSAPSRAWSRIFIRKYWVGFSNSIWFSETMSRELKDMLNSENEIIQRILESEAQIRKREQTNPRHYCGKLLLCSGSKHNLFFGGMKGALGHTWQYSRFTPDCAQ